MFRCNQTVMTPNGPATFIARIAGESRLQVSRMVPAIELSKDECLYRRPSIKSMTNSEFITWQRETKICINEIYLFSEIGDQTAAAHAINGYTKGDKSATSEPAATMPVTLRDTH